MIRIESFYAINQPWRTNPATSSHLPSIYLPVKELSDTWSMNLRALRLQLHADQRSTTTPTSDNAYWTADHRVPLETAAASERCADRPILVNVWCAIWVAHGY